MGRQEHEFIRLPTTSSDDSMHRRTSTYNAMGWKLTETVWAGSQVTTWKNHDRFGRPGQVVQPNEKTVIFARSGNRRITRRVNVNVNVANPEALV